MSNAENLPATKSMTVAGYLQTEKVRNYLDEVLKGRASQFVTSLVSMASTTQGLAHCEPKSLMMCGLKAASLNLPLDNNLGFAYAIGYKSGDKVEAQFQLGARGFVQLAMRTGQYKFINVLDIRDGEFVSWDPLTEILAVRFIQDDKERESKAIIGYAATFELVNGFKKTIFKRVDALMAHGKRFSKSFGRGPWQSDSNAMCKKTLLKELLSKWGPLSTELQEGIKFDQSVIRTTPTGEAVPEYIDAEVEEAAPVEYHLPQETIEEIRNFGSALLMTEAQVEMELGKCGGDETKAAALIADLKKKMVVMESEREKKGAKK